ncbi:glucose/galactose transporter [Pontibacter ummariensis]|uniref:Glucose/galactose transporter n=1 Tax=Pontibacter ummariensis TaxID=1610492 RepID=A0A239B7M4_9BACT|nr:sugar MFS transporter [Pontibacter ummariensis]PRY16347.1 glucose/galactose transporter [Pontibacter ummariensis]SNS03541.1 glucose/galactose transporter [Pontibacter ummariensis]
MAQNSLTKEEKQTPASQHEGSVRSMLIIGTLFFIFGFITWLNSVLIPYLRIACELNNFESYLVAFAFYVAYLVMAIPSAWVLKATGFKRGMSVGLGVIAVGALVFIPAAMTRTYSFFLIGLFIQGTGLAILQTAVNPYVTILGPRESAAKRISIMGICNKVAGALAPLIMGAIILENADELEKSLAGMSAAQQALELDNLASEVITPYLIMAGVLVVLAVLVSFSALPEVDTDQEDETVASANSNKKSVFQFPHLLLGAFTLFLYVGVEVMAGDTVISYGAAQGIALSEAKVFTTYTMVAMLIGYVIGIFAIPKYISQSKALQVSAVLGVVFALVALFTDGYVSVLFISLLGLANALMWPAIWPLAIADLGRFTKIGSSLLIMGIAGGAVLPLVYGWLADTIDPHQAYWIMVPCYLFILYFAVYGHKIRTRAQVSGDLPL